jgi:small membrane protein
MKLLPSQVIIVATVLIFLLYALRLRTVLRDRLIFAAIVLVGIALAIHPDLSTRLANAIGIGRGADLMLYIFILFSLFQTVHLAARLKSIDARITNVVRENALATAVPPPEDGAADGVRLPEQW